MKLLVIALLATTITVPALAQHAGHEMPMNTPEADSPPSDPEMPHDLSAMDHRASPAPEAPPPAGAFSGPRHATGPLFDPSAMARAREELLRENGGMRHYMLFVDRLEALLHDGRDSYRWDLEGWYGGDLHKVWLKSEGEGTFGKRPEDAEIQALYSRAIAPFFDLQAGVRYDLRPDPETAHLVLGIQGLLPYKFELDAAAFLSDDGDLTARFEFEYDQRITQRLIVQPRLELNLAAEDIPELEIGSGVSAIEAGVRLRYELRREFAPYVGVSWDSRIGDSAEFARAAGENPGGWNLVLGVRGWF